MRCFSTARPSPVLSPRSIMVVNRFQTATYRFHTTLTDSVSDGGGAGEGAEAKGENSTTRWPGTRDCRGTAHIEIQYMRGRS